MEGSTSLKEKLILAGLQEIRQHGLQDFSLRKISAACGVSCAAPYKHFRDKQDFFLEVILYIDQQWRRIQLQVLEQLGEDASTQEKLVEIAMAYIRFLMDNPRFRSLLLIRDRGMTQEYIRAKAGMSSISHALIQQYCTEVNMSQGGSRSQDFCSTFLHLWSLSDAGQRGTGLLSGNAGDGPQPDPAGIFPALKNRTAPFCRYD